MLKSLFVCNRPEYGNRGENITGRQTNKIYCHINSLKT